MVWALRCGHGCGDVAEGGGVGGPGGGGGGVGGVGGGGWGGPGGAAGELLALPSALLGEDEAGYSVEFGDEGVALTGFGERSAC